MSWYLNIIGTPDAIKSVLAAELAVPTNLPKTVVDLVTEIVDSKPWDGDTCNAFRVSGSGHAGTGASVSALTVERVMVVGSISPTVPPAVTEAVPDSSATATVPEVVETPSVPPAA
jgi:hypothetical protein